MTHAMHMFLSRKLGASHPESLWFRNPDIDVYLRAGPYHLDRQTLVRSDAIGVSNVCVTNQRKEGKGFFKALILDLEQTGASLGYSVIRVEEINNPRLLAQLQKHGYTLYGEPCPYGSAPTYHKLLTPSGDTHV